MVLKQSLTAKGSYDAITGAGETAGKIGGKWGIFALDSAKVPKSLLWRSLNTLVFERRGLRLIPNLTKSIDIPNAGISAFNRPFAWGPFSAYRRWVAGVHSTPLGSINVHTGKFVRGEILQDGVFRQALGKEWRAYYAHQFALEYGVDALIYTTTYVGYQYGHLAPKFDSDLIFGER